MVDTSENYIKMHLALPKSMREEPMEGDYFYNPKNGNRGKLGEVYFDTSKMIKLYEQDQLQAMVHPKDCTHGISFEQIDRFIEWYQHLTYNFKVEIYSMEQLWLAFVMKEKYNKVWDGVKWNKEKHDESIMGRF